MTDTSPMPAVSGANHLRSYIERAHKLEEERAAIGEDLKELYKEAKGNGFTPAALKAIVKRERETPEKAEKRATLQTIIDTYSNALGITW